MLLQKQLYSNITIIYNLYQRFLNYLTCEMLPTDRYKTLAKYSTASENIFKRQLIFLGQYENDFKGKKTRFM